MFASFVDEYKIRHDEHNMTMSLINVFVDANFDAPVDFAHMVRGIKKNDIHTFEWFVKNCGKPAEQLNEMILNPAMFWTYKSISNEFSRDDLVNFALEHFKKYDDMRNDFEEFTDEDKSEFMMYLKMFASFIIDVDINNSEFVRNMLEHVFVITDIKSYVYLTEMIMNIKISNHDRLAALFNDFIDTSE